MIVAGYVVIVARYVVIVTGYDGYVGDCRMV